MAQPAPISVPKGYQRLDAFPLDATSVFGTLTELETYAATNGTAYVGQLCAVSGTGKVYVIQSDKSLLELGAGSGGGGTGSITVSKVLTDGSYTGAITNVTGLRFDDDSGFDVVDLGGGNAKVQMNSTFKFWEVNGEPGLTAQGLDTANFIAGSGIGITADAANNSLTFTALGGGGVSSDEVFFGADAPDPSQYKIWVNTTNARVFYAFDSAVWVETFTSMSGFQETTEELMIQKMITGGDRHFIHLDDNGIVTAWGLNTSGQCNVPAGLNNVAEVAGGNNFSLALTAEGTVVGWGGASGATIPWYVNEKKNKAIAAGSDFALALRQDGTVVGWGAQTSSKQLHIPDGLTDVIDIAANVTRCVALKNDGTVVHWGSEASTVWEPKSVIGIACTDSSSSSNACIALRHDGRIYSFSGTTNPSLDIGIVSVKKISKRTNMNSVTLPVLYKDGSIRNGPSGNNYVDIGQALKAVAGLQDDGGVAVRLFDGAEASLANVPAHLTV